VNLKASYAVCKRDLLRFNSEKSRWFGLIVQPLIFWVLIGFGLKNKVNLNVSESPESNYLLFFFPGALVMTVLFTTMFSSISIIEDRAAGFLQGVLVVFKGRSSLMAGKIAAIVVFVAIQIGLSLVFAPLAQLNFSGVNWFGFFAAVVLGTIGLSSLNLAFAWLLNSVGAFHGIMGVLLFPMWILSGALFPNPGGFVGFLQSLNPLTYFVDALRVSMGVSTSENLVNFVVLGIFAILSYMIAVYATSERRMKVAHS
jgi:ABC-2 type transport system permease protein